MGRMSGCQGRPAAVAAALALVVGGALIASPSASEAQERERLRERCVAGTGTPAGPPQCLAGALLAEAVLGGAALALTGGSELPGSPSTIGRRYGTSPRWALSGRAGMMRFSRPGTGTRTRESIGAWIPSLQAEVAVGVYDGLRLGPTVGGFLSVDLLATLGVAFLPGGDGGEDEAYDGGSSAWGYGARLGIVRESFSLPGVTVAAVRRQGADFRFGPETGPGVSADGLAVTSVRGTVGKEFLALGVMGGIGWDRVSADGTLRAVDGAEAALDGFRADRLMLFGALTRTWLVVQVSAEGGFATGYDEAPAGYDGEYEPAGGSIFGSLSFRMLF
jgi:hypothetical protein